MNHVSVCGSAGYRAAGCLPGSGVPASSEDHRSSGEGLRAAALGGPVKNILVTLFMVPMSIMNYNLLINIHNTYWQ